MVFARRVLLAILLAVTLASCGPGDGVVRIRFWNGFTGPDGRTMLGIVREFNEANPDVQVLMQRLDWSTYYNKLFVAGMGGRAPELFIVHVGNLERFLQADFIASIEDLVTGAEGLDTNDLVEHVWAATERDGVHYALPLDVHVMGMYYNRTLFREAGLVDDNGEAKPPETRAEFLAALDALTQDADGDGRPEHWGFVFTWFRTNMYAIMSQFGGRFFSEDYSRCTLSDAGNVEALQFCVDLVRKYRYAPPPENFDAWIGFRQGRVGISFEGIYMLADLRKQDDLDAGGAPLPLLGQERATWAGSHALCLRAGLTDEQRRAAWRFMKYVSEHSLDWAEGGQIPVRKSLLASERFQNMELQSAFAEQLPYIRFNPRVPFIFEFFSAFDAAVEKALRGTADPLDALLEAEEHVNKAIARQRALAGGST